MHWRLINSGFNTGAVNMAMDEAVLLAHKAGDVPPTVRFYGWRPATVTLGYFQKVRAEIDLAACREQGIAVVRRLTGGRAVLHDRELTYSVVVKETHPLIPQTITAAYRFIGEGLLAGLKNLGINARLGLPPAVWGLRKQRPASPACFDASARYEITVNGRKLAGSAQVRKEGILLQHGSILLNFDAHALVSLLRLSSPELRRSLAETLSERAVSLSEILGREVGWQELYAALADTFGPALGVRLKLGELTEAERVMTGHLAEGKYSRESWNLSDS